MQSPATSAAARVAKAWRPRLNLYQVFILFSIAAVWLLLARIEKQQEVLIAKREKLFSLDHDLYIDHPQKVAGVRRARSRPDEPSWNVYIPPNSTGTVVMRGQPLGEIPTGKHLIRACLRQWDSRITELHLVIIDDAAVRIDPPQAMATFEVALPSITELDVGNKLPLLHDATDTSHMSLWIETKRTK